MLYYNFIASDVMTCNKTETKKYINKFKKTNSYIILKENIKKLDDNSGNELYIFVISHKDEDVDIPIDKFGFNIFGLIVNGFTCYFNTENERDKMLKFWNS